MSNSLFVCSERYYLLQEKNPSMTCSFYHGSPTFPNHALWIYGLDWGGNSLSLTNWKLTHKLGPFFYAFDQTQLLFEVPLSSALSNSTMIRKLTWSQQSAVWVWLGHSSSVRLNAGHCRGVAVFNRERYGHIVWFLLPCLSYYASDKYRSRWP